MDVVFQNTTPDKSFKKDFFENIIKAGIIGLGLDPKNIEISINLVEESKIKELNKKYRDKDKVTDVLSFPMIEKLSKNLQPSDIGDIFICLPFAKKEAKSENIDIDRKLAQLTVHGFLHLLGHDHEKSEHDAKKMFSLESRILSKLSF